MRAGQVLLHCHMGIQCYVISASDSHSGYANVTPSLRCTLHVPPRGGTGAQPSCQVRLQLCCGQSYIACVVCADLENAVWLQTTSFLIRGHGCLVVNSFDPSYTELVPLFVCSSSHKYDCLLLSLTRLRMRHTMWL
jgi:hypothetical protein